MAEKKKNTVMRRMGIKLLNMVECHVIGQINNEEFVGLAHIRLHVKITGHRTKLKQELLIN